MPEDKAPQPDRTVDRAPTKYGSSGRRLTTGQKLAILACLEAGMPWKAIAAQEHCSLQTISNVKNDPELWALHGRALELTKRKLAGRWYNLADLALDCATEEKAKDSSFLQLATAAGIATEKGRLMDGLSTENLSVRGVLADAANDLAELRRKRNKLDPSQSE